MYNVPIVIILRFALYTYIFVHFFALFMNFCDSCFAGPIQPTNLFFLQSDTVAMILVVVPVTTATVEKTFSDMKLVKSF